MKPRWGSIAAAAQQLDCSTRTIRRMIARGELAGRAGPRLLRVDLNEVDALLKPIPTA
jgi:excisionase family DNA binding protein